eukprot:GHVS01064633.1.p1 GENE.GHVS01064633.1~~GHVS01064633.1.p1  ORF type:complete len:278 (-),score=25.39 GHVS01064633.1:104-937(-)
MFKEKKRCAKLRLALKRLKCLYELTRLDNLYHQANLFCNLPSNHCFNPSLVSQLKKQEWYQTVSTYVGGEGKGSEIREERQIHANPVHTLSCRQLGKLPQEPKRKSKPTDQRTMETADNCASPSSSTQPIGIMATLPPPAPPPLDPLPEQWVLATKLPSPPAVNGPLRLFTAPSSTHPANIPNPIIFGGPVSPLLCRQPLVAPYYFADPIGSSLHASLSAANLGMPQTVRPHLLQRCPSTALQPPNVGPPRWTNDGKAETCYHMSQLHVSSEVVFHC